MSDAAVSLWSEEVEGCSFLWGLFSDCLSVLASRLCVQKRTGWDTENVDLISDPLLTRVWAWVAAPSSASPSAAPHPRPAESEHGEWGPALQGLWGHPGVAL